MKNSVSGFSLLELIITVAIIGILSAIAYPSYQGYTQQSRRADAKAALIAFQNAMERFYSQNNTYIGAADGGGATGAPDPDVFPDQVPLSDADPYYNLEITAADATTFTLSAVPTGQQSGDDCGTFTIDQAGTKGGSDPDCW